MTNKYIRKNLEYDDQYPTCLECRCRLMVYSETYDIRNIGIILNLEPTLLRIKGDIIKTKHSERSVPISFWELSSEASVKSKDLRRHINWLISKLSNKIDTLKKVKSNKDCTIFIQCVWWSRYGDGGPVIWPEQMQFFSDSNLDLKFDLYFEDGEEILPD